METRWEVAAGMKKQHTLPTADSPKSTSFTLLVGFGAAGVESAIGAGVLVANSPDDVEELPVNGNSDFRLDLNSRKFVVG